MHGRRTIVQLIQRLDKLAREDIGKTGQCLSYLHDRPKRKGQRESSSRKGDFRWVSAGIRSLWSAWRNAAANSSERR